MTDLVQDMELSRDGKTLTIAAGKEVRSFYLLVAWDPAHPQGCGAGAFLRRSKRPRPFAHPQDADLVLGRGRCVTAPAGRQVHCGMFLVAIVFPHNDSFGHVQSRAARICGSACLILKLVKCKSATRATTGRCGACATLRAARLLHQVQKMAPSGSGKRIRLFSLPSPLTARTKRAAEGGTPTKRAPPTRSQRPKGRRCRVSCAGELGYT